MASVLALIGRLAFAQPADSELLTQGKAAYQSGDLAAASRLFEAAYRENPGPDLLYAAGMASYEANDCARAIALLREYLDRSPPKATEIAGERIAECERRVANARSEQRAERLGRLRGALEARDCDRAREAMEAWLETEPDEAQVEVLRGELADCTPLAVVTRPAAKPDPRPPAVPVRRSGSRRAFVRRPVLLGAAGAGVAVTGVGIALAWLGDRAARDANTAAAAGAPIDDVRAAIDTADQRRTQGIWLASAGIATAVAAYAVHVLVPRWEPSPVELGARPTTGGGEVRLTVRF